MTFPTRDNPYSFNEFLEWRNNFDFYADDLFIQQVIKCFTGEERERVNQAAREISPKVSFRWRKMAESSARPEERPYMIHYDGHKNRIDRIVRPQELLTMEKEIFAEGCFSRRTSPWEKLIKMYLIYQNGEACIGCPMTCTEGAVAIIEKYADTPELKYILQHLQEGCNGEFAIGAQYLSEIQGGSDVPANLLEAVNENGTWRLYGTKFFCSATHADYAMVTAKPRGSEDVALFVIPSWLPGNKVKEVRNGYTIDRIKWKMGTSELTTAEITFDGATAYPVGPLDRGVANVVGVVLTFSRLTVGLSAAAFMTRAVREALHYARFRDQFGVKIGQFPLLASQLRKLEKSAQRTTAGAFKLYRDFLQLPGGLKGGLAEEEPEDVRKKRFEVRELIMLQKITASWDSTDTIRGAMSVFGGHGVMEDFSVLPRLYRDAAVNELWEGPRNVLLTQMHRDFQRASRWYDPREFVERILHGAPEAVTLSLADEMAELLAHPDLLSSDERTLEVCERWDKFCGDLYHAYQDLALAEVESP
ncbi:MAG: acyl-CoA dehydrogenase family protein [Deltaproteobacteria bacterium]